MNDAPAMPDSARDSIPPPGLPPVEEHHRDGYLVSTDPTRLHLDAIHGFLTQSYWAKGITLETVRRSLAHSLCFGLYDCPAEESGDTGLQVGFARVVTDFATFAYLGDVFVLESRRGQGLSKWMMECILAHSSLQGLRRWLLATADAHGLYRQFGFSPLASPDRWMDLHAPDVYSETRGARREDLPRESTLQNDVV